MPQRPVKIRALVDHGAGYVAVEVRDRVAHHDQDDENNDDDQGHDERVLYEGLAEFVLETKATPPNNHVGILRRSSIGGPNAQLADPGPEVERSLRQRA